MNQYAIAHAIMAYGYNRSAVALAQELFPTSHPSYQAEWVERFSRSLPYATGYMSEDTFRRFVDLALKAYGAHAQERYTNSSP